MGNSPNIPSSGPRHHPMAFEMVRRPASYSRDEHGLPAWVIVLSILNWLPHTAASHLDKLELIQNRVLIITIGCHIKAAKRSNWVTIPENSLAGVFHALPSYLIFASHSKTYVLLPSPAFCLDLAISFLGCEAQMTHLPLSIHFIFRCILQESNCPVVCTSFEVEKEESILDLMPSEVHVKTPSLYPVDLEEQQLLRSQSPALLKLHIKQFYLMCLLPSRRGWVNQPKCPECHTGDQTVGQLFKWIKHPATLSSSDFEATLFHVAQFLVDHTSFVDLPTIQGYLS